MSLLPVGISGEEAGYQIERSLRFNSADSAYLSRTPASAGNRKTWTWSGWVKRSTLGSGGQQLFSAGASVSDQLFFQNSTDILKVYLGADTLVTSQVFRDVGAWFHVVLAIDTTQATSSNRAKLYVNGVQVTAFSSTGYPSQNYDTKVNDAVAHNIGRYQAGASDYFPGYLTEINFIDGQALHPTSFGEFNTDTGVWQPKAYTGSYGTNGFYLNFSDNSSVAALGYDAAGSNDWTPNNFSVTAGAGNDSLVDTPTNYGTDTGVGGEVRGNYATFSAVDKASTVNVTNGSLDVAGTGGGGRARASMAVSSGKWYYEFLMNSTSGGGSCGLMAIEARSDVTGSGSTCDLGVNANTWGVFTDGGVKNNNTSGTSVTTISNGDVGMFAIDMDSGKFWYGKNGTWTNSGNPSTGANPVYSNLSGYTIAPGIGHGVSTSISYSFNFGQRPFAYSAPSGFKALCTQNLPEPTIVDGSQYFDVSLWTGTGASSQTVTNSGMQTDFVWLKQRNGTNGNGLYDVLRGVGNYLGSDATAAETYFSNTLTGFTSNGFTVGNHVSTGANGSTYVAWQWKANGAGVSNTDGTITSTVSANTDSGFSIVTWSGTGVASDTVGHGLGVQPAMVITKARSGTYSTNDWWVAHQGTPNAWLQLNTTGAAGTGGGTNGTLNYQSTFTSTVFKFLTGSSSVNNANGSGTTYVAYCFAPVAGYSAFGSVSMNGSADGSFIYTGFLPKLVLLKRSDSTSNWIMWDTVRNTYNVVGAELYPNLSNAESTVTDLDILSNGFKMRNSGFSGTWIYAAWAEVPFRYSLAR